MNKQIIVALAIALSACVPAAAQEAPRAVSTRGSGKVQIVQYDNGQWQMLLEGKPYFIKGLVYEPVKIGERLTSSNLWMTYDENGDGKPDTAYDAWVDANYNNVQDADERAVGDFALMQAMGANTIRIYHPTNIKKEVLRDLYRTYGIRVMMGNFFGAYTWGSKASWKEGTDYTDAAQRKNMREDVRRMIEEYKDEPYVLCWILGNENDMEGSSENSTANNTNARKEPEAYSKFLGETIRMIHALDPDHPVGVSNGSVRLLKYYAKNSPEVDFLGFNAYMGAFGFGTLWNAVKMDFDRPVVITEYGTDCYNQNKHATDEKFQARYYRGCWRDMVAHSFGHPGTGNSLGGFAYTWLDSWWFCGLPTEHDVAKGAWRGPAQDGWMNDEWMAICSQGDGTKSPLMRQLRQVYYTLQSEWKENQ